MEILFCMQLLDSILGACKMGDIGENFSNKNKKYKNIRSTILLKKIVEQIKSKNYIINNIDINIITQKPKITKFKNKMIKSISKICEILPESNKYKRKNNRKIRFNRKRKSYSL